VGFGTNITLFNVVNAPAAQSLPVVRSCGSPSWSEPLTETIGLDLLFCIYAPTT